MKKAILVSLALLLATPATADDHEPAEPQEPEDPPVVERWTTVPGSVKPNLHTWPCRAGLGGSVP